jgi:hypothetical protein
MTVEDLASINVTASALRLQVANIGVKQLAQRALGPFGLALSPRLLFALLLGFERMQTS